MVSPSQTLLLHNALRAKGGRSTRYVLSGTNHGDLAFMGNQPYDWKGCPPEVVASLGLKKT